FHSICLMDVRNDPAVAEIGQLRLFELDVEMVRWSDPGQLLAGLVETAHLPLRCQPLDVCGEQRIDVVAISRLCGRRERVQEPPCKCEIVSAHTSIPHAAVADCPGSSTSTASPVRNAFGGLVIGSTARLRRFTLGCESPVNSSRYE